MTSARGGDADASRMWGRVKRRPERWHLLPWVTAVLVALVGIAVTVIASVTAAMVDHSNERHLLAVQTRQAAALVTTAIATVEAPLQTGVEIASITKGSRAAFVGYISSQAGPKGTFTAASLWRLTGGGPAQVVSVGTFAHTTKPADQLQLINRARREKTFAATGVPVNALSRIGYALVDGTGKYAIYAERAIPPDRQVPVEKNSAFSELDFATYLGPATITAKLATTDVAPSQLPLRGHTVRENIPFGDTSVTLVTRAREHLGGALNARLWWIALVVGAALSALAAFGGARLTRRRLRAESDARTIAELYQRLDDRYGEQRSIALTLQQAMLPQVNPDIAALEIGSRYVAGADGVDVGGDWFSIIQIDDESFGFVVGDVSGRGVRAASIMARMRFTIRAYLAEGHPPADALALSDRQLNLSEDGHFATVLVGRGSLSTREVTVASAGHLPPVLVGASGGQLVSLRVGPPLGIGTTQYPSTTFTMPPGSLLMAYTDGLVERRDEPLDAGLDRLRRAVQAATGSVDEVIDTVVATLTGGSAEDDVAVLAFRWL